MLRLMLASDIAIRRAQPSAADAADFVRRMGDPDVFAKLKQLPLPGEDHRRHQLTHVPGSLHLHIVAVPGGRAVGSAGLHPSDRLRRRHTAMPGISVAPEAQRQGVGRALMQAVIQAVIQAVMQALCACADGWAQILRIELTVFTDNARANASYQAFGFRIEGTHRGNAMRHGSYLDTHAMARLHPRPPVLAWEAM